jgi:hypothetical protein
MRAESEAVVATTTKLGSIQQPLLSNGSTNKHVSTATIELQQRKNILVVVHTEMLKIGDVSIK